MKSQYDGKCKVENCGSTWKAGDEIFKHEKGWCTKKHEEKQTIMTGNTFDANPKQSQKGMFDDAVNAITIYAEVAKSIGYPPELWNLSTVWNTERMKR